MAEIKSSKNVLLFSLLSLAQIIVLRAIVKHRDGLTPERLYVFLSDLQKEFFVEELSFSEDDLLQVCYQLSTRGFVKIEEAVVWATVEGEIFIKDLDSVATLV